MRRLWVWFPPYLIGTIDDTEDGLSFRYSEEWLNWDSAFGLSASLKRDSKVYKTEAENFFGNLLPEGHARATLCRKLGISIDNDFELLLRIGQECAGALVLSDQDTPPEDKGGMEEIPIDDLAKWLKGDSAGIIDLQVKGKLRLSLAGAQNKLPLIFKDHKFFKPVGSQPTTHILKPPPKSFGNLPQNEWLHGKIYAAMGLPTANSQLIQIGKKLVLLVERYDRVYENGRWKRLHQEDFCQALAVSYKKKYENEGGPTLLSCCKTIEDRSDDVASDIDSLLKWQILNVLTGNCDGHGKNLSLLRHSDGTWGLAPFYDLVNTRFYTDLTHNLAMSVGDQFDSGTVLPNHWKKLFTSAKVSPSAYLAAARQMAETLPSVLNDSIEQFKAQYGNAKFLGDLMQAHLKIIKRNLKLLKDSSKR
ncbi:MAG: type II toxin-antitoxin system HipA family toxin [Bdellovibrionales bacterium]|nr:type II toxin-antitoxin system HipA family toxin [Bdellovibrionales bacterium]